MITELISLITQALYALPELAPGIEVPSVPASQLATALIALLLIWFLRGLMVRSRY